MGEAARSRTEKTLVLCLVFFMPTGHADESIFNYFHLSILYEDEIITLLKRR